MSKTALLAGGYASKVKVRGGKAQLSSFDKDRYKDQKPAAVLDDIVRRFGYRAITRTASVPRAKAILSNKAD